MATPPHVLGHRAAGLSTRIAYAATSRERAATAPRSNRQHAPASCGIPTMARQPRGRRQGRSRAWSCLRRRRHRTDVASSRVSASCRPHRIGIGPAHVVHGVVDLASAEPAGQARNKNHSTTAIDPLRQLGAGYLHVVASLHTKRAGCSYGASFEPGASTVTLDFSTTAPPGQRGPGASTKPRGRKHAALRAIGLGWER